MSALDLDDIEARLAKATPGPWRVNESASLHRGGVAIEEDGRAVETLVTFCGAYEGHGRNNADLIAHAPTDLRALLDEVSRLRAALARVERERDEARAEVEALRARLSATGGPRE